MGSWSARLNLLTMQTVRDRRAGSSVAPRLRAHSSFGGRGLRRLGFLLLLMSFVSATWNAVRVKNLEPGDILVALAVVVLGVEWLRTRQSVHFPVGMVVGAALIGAAGLMSAVFGVQRSTSAHGR